jgi:hypothetical protein
MPFQPTHLYLETLESRLVPTFFDVGPGHTFATLHEVPWDIIAPGDTVRVYWKATPYHDKLNLGMVGNAGHHILIQGIPNANGDPPVIDGNGAFTNPQTTYFEGYGVITVAPWTAKPNPAYIDISGLELTGAVRENGYHGPNGQPLEYTAGAAGVAMYQCSHISILDCYIHGNENGIFGKSDDIYGNISDIYIAKNFVSENGRPDSDRFHNTYVEADGVIYEFNYFLHVMGGSNVSDRSAGLVFRYNLVEGGVLLMGIAEPEDALTLVDSALFGSDYIYGNVLIDPASGGAVNMIEFGGINGDLSIYQKTLYFYDNTVINRNDHELGGRFQTTLFKADSNFQTVYLFNNIFFNTTQDGNDPGEFIIASHSGVFFVGNNWINAGYLAWNDGYQGNNPHEGVMFGEENLLLGDDPGFVDDRHNDFRLTSDSPCHNQAQSTDDLGLPPVEYQLDPVTMTWGTRDSSDDLGGIE